jgi:hypothetical protein
MKWTLDEIPGLIAHLPGAVHDLMRHEDQSLVGKGRPGFQARPAANAPQESEPGLAIGKALDPRALREAVNLRLLVHDYLHDLPHYEAHSDHAEALLAHWQKILQEQPRRLAEAPQSFWKSPRAREYWHAHLKHHQPDFVPGDEGFLRAWDDWERSAGTPAILHPSQYGRSNGKQWQDLVIRTRLHHLTQNLDRGLL